MLRRLPTLAAGLLLAVLPAAAGAQNFSDLEDPLVADRPDFSEGTDTIPRRHFQLEGGFTSTRVDDEDSQSLGELLLRIGLGDRLEARIGAGSYTWVDGPAGEVSGFEDPTLGIKVRLFQENVEMLPPSRPAVALVLSTSIPAGDEELTEDEWIPEAVLAFDWSLTERLGLSTNLGWSYPAGFEDDDRFHQFFGSLSGGYSFTDRIGGYLEYYGYTEEEEDGPSTHYLNTGVSYLISKDLQVDLRYGRGLNDPDPDDYVGFGAAVRW